MTTPTQKMSEEVDAARAICNFLKRPVINDEMVAGFISTLTKPLRQRIQELEAALSEYGEHQGVCNKKYGMLTCTCGLDAALRKEKK